MTNRFCPECGKPVNPDAHFCTECGHVLGGAVAANEAPPPGTPLTGTPPPVPPPCRHCPPQKTGVGAD